MKYLLPKLHLKHSVYKKTKKLSYVDHKLNKVFRKFKPEITEKICVYGRERFRYVSDDMDLFPGSTLDLHGYCEESSKALLHFFFEFAYEKRFKNIRIITGPGPILKNAIENQLKREFFRTFVKEVKFDTGLFEIKLNIKA